MLSRGQSPWATLPSELLQDIFRGLSMGDILNCSRVCKSWHANSHSSHVWKHVELVLGGPGILLRKAGCNWHVAPLTKSFGNNFASRVAHVRKARISHFMGTVAALARLAFSYMPKLQELRVENTPGVGGSTLLREVSASCMQLRLVDLSKCYYTSDDDVAAVVENCASLTQLLVGNTHAGIKSVQAIVAHAKSLELLSMSLVTSCDEDAFATLFDAIRRARIARCTSMADDGCALGLSRLRYLDVSHNLDISVELLCRLVEDPSDVTMVEHQTDETTANNMKHLSLSPPSLTADVRFCDRLTRSECDFVEKKSGGRVTLINNAKLRDNSKEAVREYLDSIL